MGFDIAFPEQQCATSHMHYISLGLTLSHVFSWTFVLIGLCTPGEYSLCQIPAAFDSMILPVLMYFTLWINVNSQISHQLKSFTQAPMLKSIYRSSVLTILTTSLGYFSARISLGFLAAADTLPVNEKKTAKLSNNAVVENLPFINMPSFLVLTYLCWY